MCICLPVSDRSALPGPGSVVLRQQQAGQSRALVARDPMDFPLDPASLEASDASHSLVALSATAFNTGWISVGELAITRSISLVAVCCSNASVKLSLAGLKLLGDAL